MLRILILATPGPSRGRKHMKDFTTISSSSSSRHLKTTYESQGLLLRTSSASAIALAFKVRRRPFTASVRPAVLQLRISRYPISHDDRRPMIWLWTSLIGLHPDHDMKNISGNQMPDLYEYDHHAD